MRASLGPGSSLLRHAYPLFTKARRYRVLRSSDDVYCEVRLTGFSDVVSSLRGPRCPSKVGVGAGKGWPKAR